LAALADPLLPRSHPDPYGSRLGRIGCYLFSSGSWPRDLIVRSAAFANFASRHATLTPPKKATVDGWLHHLAEVAG
jgi:hypothetical protein